VYSRYTLLVHKSNIINDHWNSAKEFTPFGSKEEHGPTFYDNRVVDLSKLSDINLNTPDKMTTTFDFQRKTSLLNEEVFTKIDTNLDGKFSLITRLLTQKFIYY
jgi:hypothetical protein